MVQLFLLHSFQIRNKFSLRHCYLYCFFLLSVVYIAMLSLYLIIFLLRLSYPKRGPSVELSVASRMPCKHPVACWGIAADRVVAYEFLDANYEYPWLPDALLIVGTTLLHHGRAPVVRYIRWNNYSSINGQIVRSTSNNLTMKVFIPFTELKANHL